MKDPEGAYRNSSSLSLTSALNGVGGHRHAPASLPPPPPGNSAGTKGAGAWVGPEPVWTGVGNLVTTGIRSPDRPARSESQYVLRYEHYLFPLAQQPPVGQGLLIILASRSHSVIRTTLGRTPLDE
jgi:hypothetical protein